MCCLRGLRVHLRKAVRSPEQDGCPFPLPQRIPYRFRKCSGLHRRTPVPFVLQKEVLQGVSLSLLSPALLPPGQNCVQAGNHLIRPIRLYRLQTQKLFQVQSPVRPSPRFYPQNLLPLLHPAVHTHHQPGRIHRLLNQKEELHPRTSPDLRLHKKDCHTEECHTKDYQKDYQKKGCQKKGCQKQIHRPADPCRIHRPAGRRRFPRINPLQDQGELRIRHPSGQGAKISVRFPQPVRCRFHTAAHRFLLPQKDQARKKRILRKGYAVWKNDRVQGPP